MEARRYERAGDLARGARGFEEIARDLGEGRAASEAWYRAGRLWLDPANERRSYARAMVCFKKVDQEAVSEETARDVRLWISALSRLVSAQEALAATRQAMGDVAEGAEALRGRGP